MGKRELICIGCPMGCPVTVEMEGDEIVNVSGNTCPRGDAYARKEVTNGCGRNRRGRGGDEECIKDREFLLPVVFVQNT